MLEKDKLIIELMQLAYLVHVNTEYCVFIEFSGHVDSVRIEIRKSKKEWETEILKSEFYAKYKSYMNDGEESWIAQLKAKKDILIDILETGDVCLDDCEVEEEIVRHYSF